ncbi:unnamed protein product [Psylliodes chrysocephalus]|uniref:Uncharacterized protein n=1 Tax=Psylliodes chrysocephalus TaxID=3402493 RepID=A0A9P0GGH4_9CUCU|nr:unnamed protein product [Psylliodes chrysocephala]
MKLVLFTLSCYLVYLEALKCEIGQKNGDKIKQALSKCVKNNETLERIWEMSAAPTSFESSESSEEEKIQSVSKNSKSDKSSRNKRSSKKDVSTSTEKDDDSTSDKDNANATEDTRSTGTDTSQNCIIHCVLNQMELADLNGLPDHSKLVERLLKDVNGRELRNFLQDTVDECYQEVNDEDNLDICSYSNKLVKCLADKGRSNCSDWPAGSLPF